MYYNQSWAAKGQHGHYGHHQGGGRERHLHTRSMERAAVNIHRTDNSFEILVFAPGRIKEHFHLGISGNELSVSYTPPEGFPGRNGSAGNIAAEDLSGLLRWMSRSIRRVSGRSMRTECCRYLCR